MSLANLIEKIKYQQPSAIKCGECGGKGNSYQDHIGLTHPEYEECLNCNKTGKIIPLIEDVVINVVYDIVCSKTDCYVLNGKGFPDMKILTKGDHLAHAFIKLAEVLEFPECIEEDRSVRDNLNHHILAAISYVVSYQNYALAISEIISYCQAQNIDLEEHVLARLEFMKTKEKYHDRKSSCLFKTLPRA